MALRLARSLVSQLAPKAAEALRELQLPVGLAQAPWRQPQQLTSLSSLLPAQEGFASAAVQPTTVAAAEPPPPTPAAAASSRRQQPAAQQTQPLQPSPSLDDDPTSLPPPPPVYTRLEARVEGRYRVAPKHVFALVELGGTQYKVTPGDVVVVEKLGEVDVSDTLSLGRVLLLGSRAETVIGRPYVPGAAVTAAVEVRVRCGAVWGCVAYGAERGCVWLGGRGPWFSEPSCVLAHKTSCCCCCGFCS